MIEDPINMKRKTDRLVIAHFKKSSEPFFYVTDNLVGLLKSSNQPYWSIARKCDILQYYVPGYYIGLSEPGYNNSRTREEMIDLLKSKFPGHLEWLIWNPGWL